MESRAARTGTVVTASQPVMLSVMLSVLRSNQVDLGGFGRLDRLARLRVKAFGFMQVIENNPERE
jgi:hypothetical protein